MLALMAESPQRKLDLWHKVNIQRILADDLHSKHAALYGAQHRVGKALKSTSDGVMPPDSNLMVKQACLEFEFARAALEKSLERWKNFVISETVPGDIEIL